MTKEESKDTVSRLVDAMLKDAEHPEDLISEDGLLKQIRKALIERILSSELSTHLGYEKHAPEGRNGGNSRNGNSQKTIKGDTGEVTVDVPRDREGTFEPQLIRKHQSRLPGFDSKVLSLYARGLTTRDIQGHLEELYGVEVSPTLISNVTDAVMDEVTAWQSRPLDPVYPILFLDAIFVKIRENGTIVNKAVYVAIGVNMSGTKEVLGLWFAATEGAKFWLQVLTEIQSRGVQDIFVASVDGLSGFPDALESVFPRAQVQLCIVHMIRNSLSYVSYKDKKTVAADLKTLYRASTEAEGRKNLDLFAAKWDTKYPMISRLWKRHWERLSTFFAYPTDIEYVKDFV